MKADILILDCAPVLSPDDGDVLWVVIGLDGVVVSFGIIPAAAHGTKESQRDAARAHAVAAWELYLPLNFPLPDGFETTEARLTRIRSGHDR